MNNIKLYYVHDPMCSWCWAFRPVCLALMSALPEKIDVIRLVGGLAQDSDEPMSEETRAYVQKNWQAIEKRVPGTQFNYAFWQECEPRRSTYPACRAVIAARKQGSEFDPAMTFAIQQAYYLQARNPSDYSILIELAGEIGLDAHSFAEDVRSIETDELLRQEIKQTRRLGMNTFPSLLLDNGARQLRIEPDYLDVKTMLDKVDDYLLTSV